MTTGNWPSAPPQTGVVTVYLTYHIWYSDLTAYQAAIATYGNQYILRSPAYMRSALGISETAVPWDPVEDTWIQFNLSPGPAPVTHNFDGTWAAKKTNQDAHIMVYPSPNGDPFYWPSDTQYVLDYDVDWFIWPASPAVNNPPWPVGKPVVFIWEALIMSKTGSVSATPTTITPAPGEGGIVRQNIRPRRFSQGFETTTGGSVAPIASPEGLEGATQSEGYTRAASRTPDGIGYLALSTSTSCRMLTSDNGVPSNIKLSAERIYVKFQKFPSTATRFLTYNGSGANGSMSITIDENGELNAFTINNFLINSGPLGAGATLALDTWYRLDPYIEFFTTGTGSDCTLIVKIKGVEALNVTGTVDTGFGPSNINHASTDVISGGNGLEVMFDDWENIDPGPSGNNLQEGTIDYWTGIHIQLIRNTGFNESADWTATNGYPASMQRIPAAPLVNITSSTSGARLSLTSDMNGIDLNDKLGFVRQQGTICLNVLCAVSKGSASTTDEIGYMFPGGEDTVVKSMGTALQGYHRLFSVSEGLLDPIPVEDLEPTYPLLIKSTDANATNVVFLALEATFMGQYGPEDAFVTDEFQIGTGIVGHHNAPYWGTFLGRSTVPPPNSVSCASGTYVGNGTFQDIEVAIFGIHWLLIRNTSTHQKTWWWSTHLGPHLELVDDAIRPALMMDIDVTDDGTTIFKLANNNNASNANGVTYQYIAFSDPMSRVLLNTPFRQDSAGGVQNTLFDGGFTPEFAMVQAESVKNNSASVNMYAKGSGFSANEAKNVTVAAPVATGLTFGTGNVNELTTVAGAGFTRSMALWRQYADNDNTKPIVTYIGNYTGNGAGGTRSISVTLGDRRPLFCMVVPLSTIEAYIRDPSHTTNTSGIAGTTSTSTTAITGGGVNEIQVGTTLNQNGVVYSVFIIPACTDDAGNGGWGVDGICALADPGWETIPDWMLTPPDPPGFNILGSGGIVLSGESAMLLLQNAGGIYKLVPGQRFDHLQDTQVGQPDVEVPIPNPYGKTGFIGG